MAVLIRHRAHDMLQRVARTFYYFLLFFSCHLTIFYGPASLVTTRTVLKQAGCGQPCTIQPLMHTLPKPHALINFTFVATAHSSTFSSKSFLFFFLMRSFLKKKEIRERRGGGNNFFVVMGTQKTCNK